MRRRRRGRDVRLHQDGEEPVVLRECFSSLWAVMRGRGGDGEVVRLDQVISALMDPGKTSQRHRNHNEDKGF